ncbi:MAG: hypothetical protein J6T71_04000 [Paludibacteraceae bacterium]|nr:hypothetical protein [Paludibacteraceae bacterium]
MKKILLLLAVAGMMIACGGGNEPAVKSATAKVTPEGGKYELSNGVTLIVPSGAVSGTTEVKVDYLENLDESTGSLPADIQGLVKFSPEGLVFNQPIQVSMPLNQPATGRTDIVYWSEADKTWYLTDRGEVNGEQVLFYVEHFSAYASVGGSWGDLFALMDAKVGGAQTQAEVSSALNSFLANNMWEDMGMKDFRWPTRAEMGGGAVSTCAQCCGLFASWASQEGANDRQGSAQYKEESKHNIITGISLFHAEMSAHLRSEYQVAADRIIEIYGEPCPAALKGVAEKSTIEKGKKTEVTITATCDGSPLADQLLEFSCSTELSCDTRNKKTDINGQVTVTVKGEEEGSGTLYVKAINAMDDAYDSNTTVAINVGGGEKWRITMDMHVRCTASFLEEHTGGLYSEDYKVEGGDQSLEYSYTQVADITISEPQKYDQYLVSQISGKASVTNHRDQFKCELPTFKQSGKWTDFLDNVHTANMTQDLSASPQFTDHQDIPLVGTYYTGGGNTTFAFFVGFDDLESTYTGGIEEEYNLMVKYTFLDPKISGSWSASDSDGESESGSWYYGKVGLNEEGNGKHLALCTAGMVLEASDLQEGTYPIWYTNDGPSLSDIKVGSYTLHTGLNVYVGIYPSTTWVALPGWIGDRHWTVSGSLKIERMDNKK